MPRPRWDRCVSHRGAAAEDFIREFFSDGERKVLLIAGAGFDPRSAGLSERLVRVLAERLKALLIREERPAPAPELQERADRNAQHMAKLVPESSTIVVPIFAADNAVIGGRTIAREIDVRELTGFTDIAVDLSALSVGIAFPLLRQLLERAARDKLDANIHVMVLDDPDTDRRITAIASDKAETVTGFKGELGLSFREGSARLWLPQLVSGQRAILERIHAFVDPHSVCPILPFPSSNPRTADDLITHYQREFASTWSIDSSGIVYADEKNPLDIYRTILRIDGMRAPVFSDVCGSHTILSPLGSKVLGIGIALAAVERNFPVVHVEALAYKADFENNAGVPPGELAHLWLHDRRTAESTGGELS